MIDLSTSLLTERQRAWVLSCAVAIVAVTIGVLPFASQPLGQNFPLFAAIYGCVFAASLITSYCFLLQYRSSGTFESGILALAYLSLTLLTPLYGVAFVTSSPALAPSASTPGWLYFLWHLTFLSCLVTYAFHELPRANLTRAERQQSRIAVLRIASAVGIPTLIFVIVALSGHFPPTMISAQWSLLSIAVMCAIIALGVTATVRLALRSHGRTMLDAWLAVAALVMTCEVLATMAGLTRGSVGWWTARVEHVVLALVILFVFLAHSDKTIAQTLRAHSLLAEQAMLDGLTGIPNRRKFDRVAADAVARMHRTDAPFVVALIDIDRFKFYNDEYGHLAGDETLRAVATTLQGALRDVDFVARYGGEEFALVLPDTDLLEGEAVCRRLRGAVQALGIPHASVSLLQVVTVSIGLAVARPMEETADVAARADEALYRAKANGRNRVEIETAGALAGTS